MKFLRQPPITVWPDQTYRNCCCRPWVKGRKTEMGLNEFLKRGWVYIANINMKYYERKRDK